MDYLLFQNHLGERKYSIGINLIVFLKEALDLGQSSGILGLSKFISVRYGRIPFYHEPFSIRFSPNPPNTL